MRSLVFPIVGALAGLVFAAFDHTVFGVIGGALLGWLLAANSRLTEGLRDRSTYETELNLLRGRVYELERKAETTVSPGTEDAAPAPPPEPTKTPITAPEIAPEKPAAPPVTPAPEPPRPPRTEPVPPPAASAAAVEPPSPAVDTTPGVEDHLQRLLSTAKRWLTTGNIPVKVGVILSFFGVSFLFKWAVDQELLHFPIEARLAGVALGSIVMLVIGWRLRERMRTYALSLQGGGVGILYLTIFAAYRIYELIPAGLAFALLVFLTAFAAALAVLQDSKAMAILGTLGGFLAPILASTGAGNHVALFTYYLVLNSAIFGIAYFKTWRELNLLGFLFTYGIGATWGYQYYRPELMRSTLPFVVAFFLLFLGIAVLYAYRRATVLKDYVDGTIVFGTPVITFGMLAGLLAKTEYAMAASSITAAIVYMITATLLHRWTTPRHRLLVEAFMALGVAFGTIAIPLALDARWTSAAWALEGAALVWIGVRQQRLLARVSGTLLIGAGGVAFFGRSLARDRVPVLNGDYLGGLMVSLAALFGSFRLHVNRRSGWFDAIASVGLLAWGVAWWFGSGVVEIDTHVSSRLDLAALIAFFSFSPALGVFVSRRLSWPSIAWPAFATVPVLALVLLVGTFSSSHPFENLGWLAWPLALAAVYWTLWRNDETFPRLPWLWHPPALWLLAGIGAMEVAWHVERLGGNDLWVSVAVVGLLGLLVFGVLRLRIPWHVERHRSLYLTGGVAPLLLLLLAIVAGLNLRSSGDPSPLPYIPVLNPLDIAGVLSVVILGMWILELQKRDGRAVDPKIWRNAIALVAFCLSTATVVRTVHHLTDVPFTRRALFASVVLQATLSIFWGLLGLTAMIAGARKLRRDVWIAGAVLMTVVVAKLMLVDLGNSGTLARVFSFLGVGVLLLVVGYFAGVPPRQETDA